MSDPDSMIRDLAAKAERMANAARACYPHMWIYDRPGQINRTTASAKLVLGATNRNPPVDPDESGSCRCVVCGTRWPLKEVTESVRKGQSLWSME